MFITLTTGGPPQNMEPGQMHPLGPLGGPPPGPPHPSGDSPFPPGSMMGGPGVNVIKHISFNKQFSCIFRIFI